MADKRLDQVSEKALQKVLGINGSEIVAEAFTDLFTRGGVIKKDIVDDFDELGKNQGNAVYDCSPGNTKNFPPGFSGYAKALIIDNITILITYNSSIYVRLYNAGNKVYGQWYKINMELVK